MRVSLLFNTRSGRGKAAPLADALKRALETRRHDVDLFDLSVSQDAARNAVMHTDIVCILGGDGSIHHALPFLMNASVAMYHVPLGTENLFSRAWKMTGNPQTVVDAVERNRTELIDVGLAGNRPFSLMVSIGPDASVIQRVQKARAGPITHASYLPPLIAEFISPALRPISIWVDGQRVVDQQAGICIIANSSQYGARIDPASSASVTDGKLDVYFAPATNGVDVLAQLLRARLRVSPQAQVACRQGVHIKIEAGDLPSQIDGEPLLTETGVLICTVVPRSLRILLP